MTPTHATRGGTGTPPASTRPPAVPHVAGYDIEALLGRGSSASVWRATARATGVSVAIKIIPRGTADPTVAEISALRVLDHPNLVRLHDVVATGTHSAVVLDLAAGGSLADVLATRDRLTAGEVITALHPIASALAHVHAAGLVHGDVSAGNVLFAEDGRPLLADLGTRRLIADADDLRTGQPGTSLPRATPAYADPLVASGLLPGAASDVFGIGAVAFHALTGQTVWPVAEPAEMFARAMLGLDGDEVRQRLAQAGVPAAVIEVVARALANEPELRGGAADFALDLRYADRPLPLYLGAGRIRVPGLADPVAAALTQGARLPSPLPDQTRRRDRRRRWFPRLPQRRLSVAVRRVRRWRWPATGWSARRVVAPVARRVRPGAIASVLIGAGLLLVAVALLAGRDRAGQPIAPVAATPATAAPGVVAPAVAAPGAMTAANSATGLDIGAAHEVLVHLDSLRERAYAQRDPTLLRQVYAGTDLLTEDVALLRSLVPPDCGLYGVHTEFGDPMIDAATADQVRLRVRASLAGSILRCGGADVASAAGAPAQLTLIVLQRDGSDYRIAVMARAEQ